MAFSSILFLVYFLPVFLLLLELIPSRFVKPYLLVASICFYGWGAPVFLLCLVAVTAMNFFLVRFIARPEAEKRRKMWLVAGVVFNLGLLFVFKYFNFFFGIYEGFVLPEGEKVPEAIFDIALPLGISFFTFESLTYLIDVYRREQQPLKSFWEFQLYIIYFPKLIAGPIVRYKEIAPQLSPQLVPANFQQKVQGLFIFFIGLSKKVIIANTLAPVADRLEDLSPLAHAPEHIWICVLAYTFQIYFDFSGYSDMAIGISKIIGLDLQHNFNNPYAANSVTEFWKRWHISLTSWFRNYLYIPLGGNRGKPWKTYRNLVLVFLLSGLWHGAKWNYIIWGAYHGLWLLLERVALHKLIARMKWMYLPVTFFIVALGWLIFRVENTSDLQQLFKRMFGFDSFMASERIMNFKIENDFIIVLTAAALFSFAAISKRVVALQQRVYSLQPGPRMATVNLVSCLALYVLCLGYIAGGSFNPFIYFRF